MSPIIKDSDGHEPSPITTDVPVTLPSDFSSKHTPQNKVKLRENKSLGSYLANRLSSHSVDGDTYEKEKCKVKEDKKTPALKRSQSLRIKSPSAKTATGKDDSNRRKSINLSQENVQIDSNPKEDKLGKLKSFTSKFTRFSKLSLADVPENKESPSFYALRRSQSLKVVLKKTSKTNQISSIFYTPTISRRVLKAPQVRSSIENSKSMHDVRSKDPIIISRNHENEARKKSVQIQQPEYFRPTSNKNFAHKTIDVLKNKLKKGIVNKQLFVDQFDNKKKVTETVKRKNSKTVDYKIKTDHKNQLISHSKRKKLEGHYEHVVVDNSKKPSKTQKEIERNKKNSAGISKNKGSMGKTKLKEVVPNGKEMHNHSEVKENCILFQKPSETMSRENLIHSLFLSQIDGSRNRPEENLFPIVQSVKSISTGASTIMNKSFLDSALAKLSGSLPVILLSGITTNGETDPVKEMTNLTRSHSEACVSESSVTISMHEVDMKSSSPMSTSQNDDSKREFCSPMSFTDQDAYIEESMDDLVLLQEEDAKGSYFGTLFVENKNFWENLNESFSDMDMESDHTARPLSVKGNENTESVNHERLLRLTALDSSGESQGKLVKRNNNDSIVKKDLKNIVNSINDVDEVIDEIRKGHAFRQSIRDPTDESEKYSKGMTIATSNHLESTCETHSATTGVELIQPHPLHDSNNANKVIEKSTPPLIVDNIPWTVRDNIEEQLDPLMNDANSNTKTASECSAPNASELINSKIVSKQTTSSLNNRRKFSKINTSPSLVNFKKLKSNENEKLLSSKVKRKTSVKTLIVACENQLHSDSLKSPIESDSHLKENAISSSKQWSPKREEDDKAEIHEVKGISTSGGTPTPAGSRVGSIRGGRLPASRVSSRLNILGNGDERKSQEFSSPTPRRSKTDSSKSTQSKVARSLRKQSDPVKILRSATTNVGPQTRSSVIQSSEQLKKIESELCCRTKDLNSAKEEAYEATRGVEALTVLVHYLVKEYDAFSTPQLKTEIERLCGQLSNVRLSLDETTASARRLEDEASEKAIEFQGEIKKQQEEQTEKLSSISHDHQQIIERTKQNHLLELRDEVSRSEIQREQLVKTHHDEFEKIDSDWRSQVEKHHERHLQALEQLNTCHTQQIKDAETAWEAKEKELHNENASLLKEQGTLKHQAKNLTETLLSDKDHRLQAVKNVCTSMQNEVESLKSVVDMRNTELHKLRDQLTDRERLIDDLEAARERLRSLQAKTEDLNAQMEQKSNLERQLLADRHMLAESLQRESSNNKRLSLENEELLWKLRQREVAMAADNLPTSTLDLVTRCSPLAPNDDRGSKSGGSSPQVTPRSQRLTTKSQILKSEHEKRWTQSFGNIPEEAKKHLRKSEMRELESIGVESPPGSPRVKAVIEKSNSVSFILDLNDTFPEDPFLGIQSSPLLRKPRTPTLCRKSLQKSFNNNLEKSSSSSLIRNGRSDLQNFMNKSLTYKKTSKVYREENRMCRSVEDSKGLFSIGRNHYITPNGRALNTSEIHDDLERVSPTGMSWSVPVNDKLKRSNESKGIQNRFQVVPSTPRLLQEPDEDEYEEIENEFVEVMTLDGGEDLNSAPLTTLFAQTPSTSVSLSDSDISQCGSRGELSSDDEESTDDDEDGTQIVSLPEDSLRPLDGAGEAMIFPDAFGLGNGHKNSSNLKESISKSQISSAPSSDSEEPYNQHLTEDESGLNTSWSEDCDLTSSSEMQEEL